MLNGSRENENMDYEESDIIKNSQDNRSNNKRKIEELMPLGSVGNNKKGAIVKDVKVIKSKDTDKARLEEEEQKADKEGKPMYLFSEDNQSPYGVWIKKVDDDNKPLSGFLVGSLIYRTYRSVITIKNRNRFKVEVIFKKRDEANKLLKEELLSKHNLEAFLPGHRLTRKGIIKFIPVDLSAEDIKEGIESEVNVLEIKRLNRKNHNAADIDNKWIPSESILVTFSGQILPKDIIIFKVKAAVEPFVRKPMQCYNCFKFGHTSSTCKGKKICIMCEEIEHPGVQCTNSLTCTNCKEAHQSNDYKCSFYKKQFEINHLMAYDNLSFLEAKKIVYSDMIVPPKKTKELFPEINSNSKEATVSSPLILQGFQPKNANTGYNGNHQRDYKEAISRNSHTSSPSASAVSHHQTQRLNTEAGIDISRSDKGNSHKVAQETTKAEVNGSNQRLADIAVKLNSRSTKGNQGTLNKTKTSKSNSRR